MPRVTDHTHHIRVRETQLEMHPDLPLGASPLGDDFDGKLEVAARQLEQLEQQREEIERQKRELEELNARKKIFVNNQAEIAERLTSALTLINRQLFELRQETEDLEQTSECFNEHLTRIGKFNPESWSRANLAANLDKALAAIDQADDEYEQAAQHFDGTRSGSIFGRGGARKRESRANGGSNGFFATLGNGIAFNLPLLVLGTVALVLWWLKGLA